MNGIALMVEEHVLIKRMLTVLRKASYKAILTSEVNYDDFAEMIDFVRSYADHHHHGKEEHFLFSEMVKHGGPAAEKLVNHGMMVEHDLGRLHMAELEKALLLHREGNAESVVDIVANAVSYTHLLHRHIDKEDQVVYPFAERALDKGLIESINTSCEAFEKEQEIKGVAQKYMAMVEKFESKYI
ncbi:MAG TPA: hemerythrin [Clostridiales bacterium UBA8960]|jgi:hemerythrin-like domain-containing protein|nr:hemerythrin [Clostridiales bacterium UBA8960]